MKSAVILFFALAAVVTASNLKEESAAIIKSCAAEFTISDAVVGALVGKPSEVQATENVKCFLKCYYDKNQVVSSSNVTDVEKIALLWQSLGHDVSVFRANYAKGSCTFRFGDTCEGSWAAFKCINGF